MVCKTPRACPDYDPPGRTGDRGLRKGKTRLKLVGQIHMRTTRVQTTCHLGSCRSSTARCRCLAPVPQKQSQVRAELLHSTPRHITHSLWGSLGVKNLLNGGAHFLNLRSLMLNFFFSTRTHRQAASWRQWKLRTCFLCAPVFDVTVLLFLIETGILHTCFRYRSCWRRFPKRQSPCNHPRSASSTLKENWKKQESWETGNWVIQEAKKNKKLW